VVQGDSKILGANLLADGYVEEIPTPRLRVLRPQGIEHRNEKYVAKTSVSVGLQTPGIGAYPFEGKKSLAPARMFLSDVSGHIFTHRAPKLAVLFRDAL